jgi:hypothetical protein
MSFEHANRTCTRIIGVLLHWLLRWGLGAREGRAPYAHHWHARVHAFIVDPLIVVSEILPPVSVRVRVRVTRTTLYFIIVITDAFEYTIHRSNAHHALTVAFTRRPSRHLVPPLS